MNQAILNTFLKIELLSQNVFLCETVSELALSWSLLFAQTKRLFVKLKTSLKTLGFSLSLGVSICLDRVSIETLNLDTGQKWVSTVEKILDTFKKLVSTIQISWSRSWLVSTVETPRLTFPTTEGLS